jgi:small-conductance mechanosensitive channel
MLTYLKFLFCLFLLSILLFPVTLPAMGDGDKAAAPPVQQTGGAVSQAETETGGDAAGRLVQEAEDAAQHIEGQVAADTGQMVFLQKLGIALLIVIGQALLVFFVWHGFKLLNKKVITGWGPKIKPLTIKKFKLLNTKQIISTILFFLRILKYIVTAFQLFITVPIIFSLFPATASIASVLFGYILTPLKNIFTGAVRYVPNLITIVIILMVTRYVLRGLQFFTLQIEKERLVIPGFYADWARPTFNILRVLLYAFTVAIIYPYLPGSDSQIFQGVSILVGVIFSLGSSSAISNVVAGLVITYMRPFKIGDRIQIQGSEGFVVEKSLFVTRIKTPKNEYITFPNITILSSSIINYNTSSDEDEEGLILHADITFGYHTPWPLVHQLLISAAIKTNYVLKTPKPFVLQRALDDFYCVYQINLYTKEINRMPAIYSELYANIQSVFVEAGLDLTAPHIRSNMPFDDGETVKLEKAGTVMPSAGKPEIGMQQ